MNKRIKIYCLILAAIYIIGVGYGIVSQVDSFIAGFEDGIESSQTNESNMTYHFKVKPEQGSYTFPDTMKNMLTGKLLKTEIDEIKIELDPSQITSTISSGWYAGTTIFMVLISLLYLAIIIYMPVLFFRIVKPVTKNGILDDNIVRRITRMGWLLIGIFIIEILFFFIHYITAINMIKLEGYDIVISFSEYMFLVLGVVLLLLSEILKDSLRMKEEQDLTI